MKAKYLGRFYRDVHPIEYTTWLLNEVTDDVEYPLDDFMRTEEGIFHATLSETNTSAIALQIVDEDIVKLWRIY